MKLHESAKNVLLSEGTFNGIKEASQDADTSVPNNAVVTALEDLKGVIDRCEGFVPRRANFKNTRLLMKIQKAHALLGDVCEELEAIEG